MRRPSLLSGAGALFHGMGFVLGAPRLWGYAAVPTLVALTLVALLGWLGMHEAGRAVAAIVGEDAQGVAAAGGFVLTVVLDLGVLLVALLLGISLAQPLSGWALDTLVVAEEQALGAPPRPPQKKLVSALRSLRASLLALLVGLPVVCVLTLAGLLFPPATVVTLPLKVLVSSLLVAWDLLDYPLGRAGLGVRARLGWVLEHLGATLGLGLVATLLLFVPCAGLLVLPFGVVGAAKLAVEGERARKT